jgi:DNA-binding NtrC family response regulator
MLKILYALKSSTEAITALIGAHKVDVPREDESLLNVAARKSYDLILLEGEINFIPTIKAIDPRAEVILFGHREDMVEAIKQGAYAYFSFPIELERLKDTIDSITDMAVLRQENAKLEKQLSTNYTFFNGVVGRNPRMLEIFTFLRRMAPYYKTLLIMGETGTGKEVIARNLHSLNAVSKNPFTVCDCGALVETLVESELFGHKKGSFTGAIADNAGFFETVGEGTLFLDEIGELPLPSQASLLRVLQTGEFKRVGDQRVLKAKCRVISATNKDLQNEVKKGNFREDLYYRITQFTINIPPLRERKDDIPLMVRCFLERFSEGTGKKVLGISRPAQIILMSYDWPGNVRELENSLEQAAILTTESFIRVDDLPEYITKKSHGTSYHPLCLDDVVKKHIEEALITCNGNRSHASKILGISRRSLLRKIEKYSIKPPLEQSFTKTAHLAQ